MWTRAPRYVLMLAIGAAIAVLGASGHAPGNPLLTYQARALILALVLVGLLAAGCTLFEPPVDPYADIRQNLAA